MATPTVSVTYLKIDVTATGGGQSTLDEINTAIADTTVMERTGAGPYVYTIKRSVSPVGVYREFEISSGCDVLFERGDTLNFEGISNSGTYWIFDLASGGELTIKDGFTIDFNSDSQTYARAYLGISGALTISGTSGNPVTIQNYRSLYDRSTGVQDWDFCVLKDTTYSGGYLYYYEGFNHTIGELARSYTNITVTNTSTVTGYMHLAIYSATPAVSAVWEDWTVTNLDRVYMYVATAKLKGWTFGSLKTPLLCYGAGHATGFPGYITSKDDTIFPNVIFQPSLTFEDCTFNAFGTTSHVSVYYGAQVYFKNCDFLNENTGMYVAYGSRALEYGDSNTFSGMVVSRTWASNGTFLRCREIDITVEDSGGSPIENATVTMVQLPDYKEKHSSLTDSNGTILDVFGQLPRLVQREQASSSTFYNWSNDLSGGTAFHRIYVAKKGYHPATYDLEMTADRTVTITLIPENHPLMDVDTQTLYLPAEGRLIKKAG